MAKEATPSKGFIPGAKGARFMIGSLDDDKLDVVAQFNPRELQYERAVPWKQHDSTTVEFGGWQGRTITVELFFDGVEDNRSISRPLKNLEKLATVIEPDSKDEGKRRAHLCVACLGDARKRKDDAAITEPYEIPSLRCVIESLTVKYLVWSKEGTPLRASATVKLKEAEVYTPKGNRR